MFYESTFEDGMLTLTLPKSEAVTPKQIKVTATKSNGKN
jgi:HSP20 family molecular chaperone IbpA